MTNFKELGIKDNLIKGLNDLKIITPTDIQAEVIPLLLKTKNDYVVQAPTGTGKTAVFGLPILQNTNPNQGVIQTLILCPTRELGQQIAKQLFKFTKYTDKIFTEAVYGGAPIDKQISALRRPTHIVVATPGRLIDLVEKKAIDLSHVKTVVLDEADEMLSMGFKKELDKILSFITVEQKWLFSATLPEGIRQIINTHMSPDAHRVEVAPKNLVNKNIDHQYLVCEDLDKFNVLLQFLQSQKGSRGVVFCKTKVATDKLAKQLIAKNIPTDGLHGDLTQKERDKVMRAFKNETLQLLVSTDIAARGIDIEGLSYVVHYQLPDKEEYYTHRSGRTARAGKKGVSLALVNSKELKSMHFFEKKLGIDFKQVKKAK